jgi:predicted ester cyclase/heme-degrading monooxygenase HmoA
MKVSIAILCSIVVFLKSFNMENGNKQAIIRLYEHALNNREFEVLKDVISEEYAAPKGIGVKGFEAPLRDIIAGFPDAKWTISEIVADGDQVIVKQTMRGTHQGIFQGYKPTGKVVNVDGFAVYKFRNGKVVSSHVQTDRFGFLTQLGVLSATGAAVYFIDRFVVPKAAEDAFRDRMGYNRGFIRKLEGFVNDQVYESGPKENGDLVVITIAGWRSLEDVEKARAAVQAEYKRLQFDPGEFYRRKGIVIERDVFQAAQ